MKRMYFFVLLLFIAGISVVAGQTNQTLTQGQIFTGTITPGKVHTYCIQLRGDAEYFIAWDDMDTNPDYVDVIVGVRGEDWGQYLINVQDDGNFSRNVHRMVNQNHQSTKRNPLNIVDELWGVRNHARFVPNNEYTIEVRGLSSESGTYRIVFY